MKKHYVWSIIVFFLLIRLVSAANFRVSQNSSSIGEDYLEGDVVSGMLNISFNQQDNIDFSSNFRGKKISLLELLRDTMNLTAGSDFTCDPVGCQSYYQAHTPETVKNIRLVADKQVYGFRIRETDKLVTRIDDLSFKVDVNAPPNCVNQIYIDLFNDGSVDFYNSLVYSATGDCADYFGGKDYGCFSSDDVSRQPVAIGPQLYCESIKHIPPSAGYVLGASVVVNRPGGSLGFVMYPETGGCDYLAYNTVDNIHVGGDISVIVNYSSLEEFNAIVCVYTEPEHEGDLSIRVNEESDSCGLSFEPCDEITDASYEADYEIYLAPKGYSEIIDVTFGKELYEKLTGSDLKKDLNDYVNTTYAYNCSGADGCIVPFSIWGVDEHNQKIYSASLKYKVNAFSDQTTDIYDLRERPAKVSSNYLNILLDKLNFRVPDTTGKHTFKLFLGDEQVIQKIIDVDIGFFFNVAPRFALVGRETSFSAQVGNASVSSSVWNFGDGSVPIQVTGDSTTHTYTTSGNYFATVTLIKSSRAGVVSNSTRRFKVVVGEAADSANLTLRDYEAKLKNLEASILTFPEWIRPPIENSLGVETKKILIQNKRKEFNLLTAHSPDSDYIKLINDLAAVDIPYRVYSQSSGVVPGLIGLQNMNVAHLGEIAGTTVSNAEEVKAQIVGWMESHYDLNIGFETIAAEGENGNALLFKTYAITLSAKPGASGEAAYLIIDYPLNGMVLKTPSTQLSETSLSGGTYVDLSASPITRLEFLIVGAQAPAPADLGIYVSPLPASLGISQKPIVECWHMACDEEGNIDWVKFSIGIGIVLVFFLIVYLLLQTWYKNRYERYLFKDPNDLYNVLNFIYNSRRNGLKDKNIRLGLSQKNWSGEQITYAFHKLAGTRTGMWEIPLFKFAENRKVRKELEKKQGGRPLDIRFIKYPNL